MKWPHTSALCYVHGWDRAPTGHMGAPGALGGPGRCRGRFERVSLPGQAAG